MNSTATAILVCFYTLAVLLQHTLADNAATVATSKLHPSDKHFRPFQPATTSRPEPTLNVNQLQQIILRYVDETLSRRTYEIVNGLTIEIGNKTANDKGPGRRHGGGIAVAGAAEEERQLSPGLDELILDRLQRFADSHVVNLNIPKAMQSTGRLFFFKGLKKFMWPIFIGMQVAKTVLLAMFLPSIIGSLGKIVGKGKRTYFTDYDLIYNCCFAGLSSVSGFGQPAETVDNLEFKDNYSPDQQQQQQDMVGYSYSQGGMLFAL